MTIETVSHFPHTTPEPDTKAADEWPALFLTCAGNIESRHWQEELAAWPVFAGLLMEHPEHPSKNGSAYLPGRLVSHERKKNAVSEICALVIDCDSGDDLNELVDRIRALGLEAVVHSSFSHLSSQTNIKWDDYKRHTGSALVTAEGVRDYLVNRRHLRPDALGDVRIVDEMRQTPEGVFIVAEHSPIQKGRVVMPLAAPFVIVERMQTLNLSQREVHDLWAAYVVAMAKLLGVTLDEACTDVSRAYYWSRHPAGRSHFAAHVRGKPLDLTTIKLERDETKPHRSPPRLTRPANGGARVGEQLRAFAARHGKHFQLADAIDAQAAARVRGECSSVTGRVVECPFDELHSNSGDPADKACFVMNASDSESGGFVWKCQHASCQNHDRLDFLAKAIADGWFEESVLSTPDYFLNGLRSPCEIATALAGGLMADSTAAATNAVLTELSCCDDFVVVEMVLKKIKDAVGLGVTKLRALVDDLKKKKGKEEPRGGKPHFIWLTDAFDQIIEEVTTLLVASNEDAPRLFHMAKTPVRIVEDEATASIATEAITKPVLRQELNQLATWSRLERGGEKSIACPSDVAEHLLCDPALPLPPLTGIVDVPFFDEHGRLVAAPGYHAESFTYYHQRPGFSVPGVAPSPSREQIEEARDILLTEVFGDFPFSDGSPMSRASKAHVVALQLEPFARQLIKGFVPIYLIQKPTPGTGATLLVNAFAQTAFGAPAIPQAEVHSPEEFRKNLTATLMAGTRLYWLDNIHRKVDDPGLALATTTEVWKDRILGHSKTATLPVRCSWIISGNNVELSNELARRSVLIRLDANIERPTDRTGFRHPDLLDFVRQNRARLVWACLTLIQAWIAAGRPLGSATLASYEPWSRTMGGILAVADIEGFLENRDELKEVAADDDAPMKAFMKLCFEEFGSAQIPVSAAVTDARSLRAQSLLDLYRRHAHELDLGFNDKREESWPSLLGRCINRYKNRVFEISMADGSSIKVKLRADRTSGGAVKWLERLPD